MDINTLLESARNLAYNNRELAIALGVAAAAYTLLRPKKALKLAVFVAVLLVALYFILQLWGSLSTGIKNTDTMIHGTERAIK